MVRCSATCAVMVMVGILKVEKESQRAVGASVSASLMPKPMNSVPARPSSHGKAPQNPPPVPNTLTQADNRWQRTVRYGWDKGGSKGGR